MKLRIDDAQQMFAGFEVMSVRKTRNENAKVVAAYRNDNDQEVFFAVWCEGDGIVTAGDKIHTDVMAAKSEAVEMAEYYQNGGEQQPAPAVVQPTRPNVHTIELDDEMLLYVAKKRVADHVAEQFGDDDGGIVCVAIAAVNGGFVARTNDDDGHVGFLPMDANLRPLTAKFQFNMDMAKRKINA